MLARPTDDGFLRTATRPGRSYRTGDAHDSPIAVGCRLRCAAERSGRIGERPRPGLRPRMGRAVWPHRLGAVLSLSLRLVSAKFLGERILPVGRRPLLP